MTEIASPPQILAGHNDIEERKSDKTQRQAPAKIIASLSWKDSLPTQRLLNVICTILAEEYIMIAKQNPEVFTEIDSPRLGGAHNDEMEIKE